MKNDSYVIDLINILSFIIGVQNLGANEEQIKKLEDHLSKQDEQYEKIIQLLEKNKGGALWKNKLKVKTLWKSFVKK